MKQVSTVETARYLNWLYGEMMELACKYPTWDFRIVQNPSNYRQHPQIRAVRYPAWSTGDGPWYVATRLSKDKWRYTVFNRYIRNGGIEDHKEEAYTFSDEEMYSTFEMFDCRED